MSEHVCILVFFNEPHVEIKLELELELELEVNCNMILFFDRYPGYVFVSDNNISQSARMRVRWSEESLMGIIVDLHLLARSDFLVCTCSSNVCISSISTIFSSMLCYHSYSFIHSFLNSLIYLFIFIPINLKRRVIHYTYSFLVLLISLLLSFWGRGGSL